MRSLRRLHLTGDDRLPLPLAAFLLVVEPCPCGHPLCVRRFVSDRARRPFYAARYTGPTPWEETP